MYYILNRRNSNPLFTCLSSDVDPSKIFLSHHNFIIESCYEHCVENVTSKTNFKGYYCDISFFDPQQHIVKCVHLFQSCTPQASSIRSATKRVLNCGRTCAALAWYKANGSAWKNGKNTQTD